VPKKIPGTILQGVSSRFAKRPWRGGKTELE